MVAGGGVLEEPSCHGVAGGGGVIDGQAGCELAKGVVAGAFRGGSRSHLGCTGYFGFANFESARAESVGLAPGCAESASSASANMGLLSWTRGRRARVRRLGQQSEMSTMEIEQAVTAGRAVGEVCFNARSSFANA